MARSTGPVLALGAITLANNSLLHGQPIDWRIPVATGFAAGTLALMEHGWEMGALGIAWIALVTVLFVRIKPDVPAPVESLLDFWDKSGLASGFAK